MREPCRVCGGCIPGGQCRWLFGKCGRLQLAVVLSHLLGFDLHRDGRGEFLCGKCVFLLDRVVQCDVAISNLQDAHAARLQRLHSERDGLSTLIMQKYQRNNPQGPQRNQQEKDNTRPGRESDYQPAWRVSHQHSVQVPQQQKCQLKRHRNETKCHLEMLQKEQAKQRLQGRRLSSGTQQANRRGNGHMRRCVSLEPLSGATSDRSSSFGRSLVTRKGREAGVKAGGTQGTGIQSRSREYSDLIQRKSTLTSRSVSLQSLTLEHPEYTSLTAPPQRRQGSSSAALEISSLVSDLLQMLHCVRARPLPPAVGSRIPVLSQPRRVFGPDRVGGAARAKMERALRELEEEFNDEYLPLKQEV